MWPPVGVCRSLQRDRRPLPADQHRKDHRPGSPGEDEPSADDAAVLLRTVVSDARRVRSKVCSAPPRSIVSLKSTQNLEQSQSSDFHPSFISPQTFKMFCFLQQEDTDELGRAAHQNTLSKYKYMFEYVFPGLNCVFIPKKRKSSSCRKSLQ